MLASLLAAALLAAAPAAAPAATASPREAWNRAALELALPLRWLADDDGDGRPSAGELATVLAWRTGGPTSATGS
ncbi:MAG: hypothetical protein QM767_04570 [Anaeromyxobacter sp.]